MSMHGGMRGGTFRSFAKDPSVRGHRIGRETARRVAAYGRPFLPEVLGYLVLAVLGGMVTVAVPLLLQRIIDDGVVPQDRGVVISLALVVAGLAVVVVVVVVVSEEARPSRSTDAATRAKATSAHADSAQDRHSGHRPHGCALTLLTLTPTCFEPAQSLARLCATLASPLARFVRVRSY